MGKETWKIQTKLVLALTTLFLNHPDIHLNSMISFAAFLLLTLCPQCLNFTRASKKHVVGSAGEALYSADR